MNVTFLHTIDCDLSYVPCETHYGASAGMESYLTSLKATAAAHGVDVTLKRRRHLWELCYQENWQRACRELAERCPNCDAFLVIPSDRNGVRQTLIKSFADCGRYPADLSELLVKKPGFKSGSAKNENEVYEGFWLNDSCDPNLIQRVKEISSLLLVDDWIGKNRTMFGVKKRVSKIAGHQVMFQCAAPGISTNQATLPKTIRVKKGIAEVLRVMSQEISKKSD